LDLNDVGLGLAAREGRLGLTRGPQDGRTLLAFGDRRSAVGFGPRGDAHRGFDFLRLAVDLLSAGVRSASPSP